MNDRERDVKCAANVLIATPLLWHRVVPRLFPCVAVLCVVVHITGCRVDIPLEERPCPCGTGWSCDEELGVCVRGTAPRCGLLTTTEPSEVQLADVTVNWRTDQAFELGWTLAEETERELISHYELVVGTDEEAVRTRESNVDIFDRSSPEHPELARPLLPVMGWTGNVDRAVIRDLVPETTYYLRLSIVETNGAVSCSSVVSARTLSATQEHWTIVDENDVPSTLPMCIEILDDPARASSGERFAEYLVMCERRPDGSGVSTCDMPAPGTEAMSCWENVRLRDITSNPIPITDDELRTSAYATIDVAMELTDDAYWSELGLLGPKPTSGGLFTGEEYIWLAPDQTLVSDAQYRTYTFPLRLLELRCTEEQSDEDEIRVAAGEQPICGSIITAEDVERGFSGTWTGGLFRHLGIVRIDNVHIHF